MIIIVLATLGVLVALAVLGVLVVLVILATSSVALATSACALVSCTCITSSTTGVSGYGAIITGQSTRALKLIDQSGYCLPTKKIPTLSGWPLSVTVNY